MRDLVARATIALSPSELRRRSTDSSAELWLGGDDAVSRLHQIPPGADLCARFQQLLPLGREREIMKDRDHEQIGERQLVAGEEFLVAHQALEFLEAELRARERLFDRSLVRTPAQHRLNHAVH